MVPRDEPPTVGTGRDSERLTHRGERPARAVGYRQITDMLIADIKGGNWTVTGQLPTEAELVERFGASRNTIRESLRELEVFGYIKRRRGTRSILLATDPADGFVNSVQSIGELLQYSRRTESHVMSVDMIVAKNELAERLGAKPGSHWLRIEVLRMPLRGTLPIGFSQIYIDERYEKLAERMRANTPVYRVLEEELGVKFRRVGQVIEAASARTPVAEYLKVPVGSPLLVVRTEFVTAAGEIVEIGFGHFPAGRYRMEVILERGRRGRGDK